MRTPAVTKDVLEPEVGVEGAGEGYFNRIKTAATQYQRRSTCVLTMLYDNSTDDKMETWKGQMAWPMLQSQQTGELPHDPDQSHDIGLSISPTTHGTTIHSELQE